MTCDDCLHKSECMEQRGICREFKSLEDLKRDVERINENFKAAARRAKTDKSGKGKHHVNR